MEWIHQQGLDAIVSKLYSQEENQVQTLEKTIVGRVF